MQHIEPDVWTTLGLSPEAEVHAGHQSKVYVAIGRPGRLIVKLIEAGNGGAVGRQRVEVTRQLAEINPTVVGPVELGSDLVREIGGWQVVCYPYIAGDIPDTANQGEVEAMAATLVALHESLAALTASKLPPVAALLESTDEQLCRGQIIHGDYAAANLIMTPSGLKIIDFDDCGHGSIAFEIGNSLYMALFDAWHTGALDRYEQFRSWFVDGYRSAATLDVEDSLLDRAIQVRAKALGQWLADPTEAPTGIRTASAEWRRRLQSFVNDVAP